MLSKTHAWAKVHTLFRDIEVKFATILPFFTLHLNFRNINLKAHGRLHSIIQDFKSNLIPKVHSLQQWDKTTIYGGERMQVVLQMMWTGWHQVWIRWKLSLTYIYGNLRLQIFHVYCTVIIQLSLLSTTDSIIR